MGRQLSSARADVAAGVRGLRLRPPRARARGGGDGQRSARDRGQAFQGPDTETDAVAGRRAGHQAAMASATISPISTSVQRFRRIAKLVLLTRSEEHTSELQSPYDLVCRLLLE